MVVDTADERRLGGQPLRRKKIDGEAEFWCSLALALGGRSIAEWQVAISEEERALWLSYIAKHGPINPLRRLDGDIAELASFVGAVAGAKKQGGQPFTLTDFCNWGEPPPDEELTLEEAEQMFKAMAGNKNG